VPIRKLVSRAGECATERGRQRILGRATQQIAPSQTQTHAIIALKCQTTQLTLLPLNGMIYGMNKGKRLMIATGVFSAIVLTIFGLAALTKLNKVKSSKWGLCIYTPQLRVQSDLRIIVNAAELFKAEKGRYPGTIDELSADSLQNWSLNESIDPWGNPYIYKTINGRPHAFCYGKDGIPGGNGDNLDFAWPELKADNK
jgi:type II secretion system (T2SS) protein G